MGLVGTTRTGLMLVARSLGDGALDGALDGVLEVELEGRAGDDVRFGALDFFGVAISVWFR